MTDPRYAFDCDDATYSDPAETMLNPSDLLTSDCTATQSHGRQLNATAHVGITSPSHNSHITEAAYSSSVPTGTSPDAGLNPSSPSGPRTHSVNVQNDIGLDYALPTSNAPLSLSDFVSVPKVLRAAPSTRFEPRKLNGPRRELLHDQSGSSSEYNSLNTIDAVTTSTSVSSLARQATSIAPTEQASQPHALSDSNLANVFAQPSARRSALKRKADPPESSSVEGLNGKETHSHQNHRNKSRRVSFGGMADHHAATSIEAHQSSNGRAPQDRLHSGYSGHQSQQTRLFTSATSRAATSPPPTEDQQPRRVLREAGNRHPSSNPPSILPPEKVFPIQIGSELFRLSGASISSDAPSYFTQFFEEQIRQNEESGGVRTLYIDRDPNTFRDVARHLQGYCLKPQDGAHFVKLFADAQFYSLPRLIDLLFESEIFIQIGERHFQIPKDLFSEPGNSPNFFSLGFAVFFSSPGDVFPGLDRRGLLRPPSITPPYVANRSAETFAELLHLLRGYPLHIRNEIHRAELLRDCRYFHLRNLEQKLIAHEISYNLAREKHEISLRLEDVKPSGISFTPDCCATENDLTGGWVNYARPFVDDKAYEVVIELGGESTILNLDEMRADFHNLTKARVSSLVQVVANKMNLPSNAPVGLMLLSGGSEARPASPGHTPLSEDRVKVRFEPETDIILDGKCFEVEWESPQGQVMIHGPPADSSESQSEDDAMTDTRQGATATRHQPLPDSDGPRRRTQQSRQKPARGGPPSQQPGRQPHSVTPVQTSRLPNPGSLGSTASAKKRKRQNHNSQGKREWIIRTAQWRLRIERKLQDSVRGGYEIVLIGVKIDAYSSERARNNRRTFLG